MHAQYYRSGYKHHRFAVPHIRGHQGAPVQNLFLKIAEERLQYRLALLFLAFSMFLASILSHFHTLKLQKSCSFWGLHPQTPAESLPYISAMQQCQAVPYLAPLQLSSRITTE